MAYCQSLIGCRWVSVRGMLGGGLNKLNDVCVHGNIFSVLKTMMCCSVCLRWRRPVSQAFLKKKPLGHYRSLGVAALFVLFLDINLPSAVCEEAGPTSEAASSFLSMAREKHSAAPHIRRLNWLASPVCFILFFFFGFFSPLWSLCCELLCAVQTA